MIYFRTSFSEVTRSSKLFQSGNDLVKAFIVELRCLLKLKVPATIIKTYHRLGRLLSNPGVAGED